MFLVCSRLFEKTVLQCKFLRKFTVLGIETSCDDTGCAIVTDKREILGESLKSQSLIHLRNGGIIPPVARDLHAEAIEHVVNDALKQSNRTFQDIDAVAATVKPGLSLSLLVGARYGQKLAETNSKPFIPIHHMEAHALSVRMKEKVDFPYLVLLISGGHCLLAVANDVNNFLLLGESRDDAPGEAFDKIARRLKLVNLPEFRTLCGGRAIETAAERGDSTAFPFPAVLTQYRDCSFSFSGLKNIARRIIIQEEKLHDVPADGVIPQVNDLCASFQHAVARHLCHRVQRGMDYLKIKKLIPEQNRNLVVAGGVACNKYINKMLEHVTNAYQYKLVTPPPSLCTDNGLMIAWNGVEKLVKGIDVVQPDAAHTVDIEPRCSFGVDCHNQVVETDIKCDWVKLPVSKPRR